MGSQDSQVCEKCGKPCGYDDRKAYFDPGYLCRQCKRNLLKRFAAVFGLNGTSSDEWGTQVSWRDVDRMLSKLCRDEAMRITYYVTDKELWEKTTQVPTSVLEA